MKKLDNFINKIGIDKVLHFVVSGWIISLFIPCGIIVISIVFILLFILSIIKELVLDDYVDTNDIIAGFLGESVSMIFYLLMYLFN